MSELRDRMANAVWRTSPDDDAIAWSDAEKIADAILALPELRALAAGKTLWVKCATCRGSGFVNATRYTTWIDPCPNPTCVHGFVPVDHNHE